MVGKHNMPDLLWSDYAPEHLDAVMAFLEEHDTLRFSAFENGLFPAAAVAGEASVSGYGNVWVRDNFYVAYAHYMAAQKDKAVKNVRTLASYFKKHRSRFEKIIQGQCDPMQPRNRPHIRFDGLKLEELDDKWAHAQNDALGYFLWFFCKLIVDGAVHPQEEDFVLLACFAYYFEAISYWQDEDSGHWEEQPKIEASSIGVVVGALDMLGKVVANLPANQEVRFGERRVAGEWLQGLAGRGRDALDQILPKECVQPDKVRDVDGALLFLIYPIAVVSDAQAGQIVRNVVDQLQGDHGIRRYLGDSYWCANYKKLLPPARRAIDVSESMAARDALLRQGEEAQWCIFDPILSVIFAKMFQKTRDPQYRRCQVAHLNRSLSQLTDAGFPGGIGKCPEAYYLEDGVYVPNDQTPLFWTQANLWMALVALRESLRSI